MFVSSAEKIYGQTSAIRVALALVVLVVLGIIAAVYYDNTMQTFENTFWMIAAIVAAAYIATCVLIGKTKLAIHPEGVRYTSAFGEKELLWHDIKETRYQVTPIHVGAHFGLIGMAVQAYATRQGKSSTVSQKLTLIGQDGSKIKITSNFSNAKEAISIILGKIVPPLVADMKRRIQNGEIIQFGSVSVSLAGVRWKSKDAVAFSDIKKAEIAGQMLRIGKQGKWLDYVAVRCHKVPDVVALLEVIKTFTPVQSAGVLDPLEHVRV